MKNGKGKESILAHIQTHPNIHECEHSYIIKCSIATIHTG